MKTINAIFRIFMITFVLLLVSIILKIGVLSAIFWGCLTVEFILFYKIKHKIEDTAREYVASYKEDVRNYRIYSYSKDLERREFAKTLRTRAISTANSYNSYLQENREVFGDNMPSDLPQTLSTDFREIPL